MSGGMMVGLVFNIGLWFCLSLFEKARREKERRETDDA